MSSSSNVSGRNDGFHFSIDRGGTFTDVFAEVPARFGGGHRVLKLLSEDPSNYADAPREGIRRVLEACTGVSHPRAVPLDTSNITSIRMGTTVATNALLERKGERTALLITKGFRDLLHIGNQSRPAIFDLELRMPEVLYESVVEVAERVVLVQEGCVDVDVTDLIAGEVPEGVRDERTGITGEKLVVRKDVDPHEVRAQLREIQSSGINSVAVVLMHAYTFPDHEGIIGAIAREMGFSQVSLSSEVMPMVKMVPRGFTATADAYLTPQITRYINGFVSGFDDKFSENVKLSFMQSDGGLTPVSSFSGHKAILSGPAGGVIGYAITTYEEFGGMPVVGFDMGGTSTDVSRYAGRLEHVFETTTAGVTIQAPQLDINTVAAGGGSRLFFRSGLFVVGPESVGANPGPVCYRKGGSLAITDANLILGRIMPEHFPHIFGPTENEPLDLAATRAAFEALAVDVNGYYASQGLPHKSIDEIAYGFIKVANEAMCRPIRALTQMRGHDISNHVLACFGGAGGQHACAIARALGMKHIFIHRFAGILSAYGLGLADVVSEAQEPTACVLSDVSSPPLLAEKLLGLVKGVLADLTRQQFPEDDIEITMFVHLRYSGTDVAIMTEVKCEWREGVDSVAAALPAAAESFKSRYRTEFGFELTGRNIIVDDVRARGVGKAMKYTKRVLPPSSSPPIPLSSSLVYTGAGRMPTPAYRGADLAPGHTFGGPAVVLDDTGTIFVEPNCTLRITPHGDYVIEVGPLPSSFSPIGLSSPVGFSSPSLPSSSLPSSPAIEPPLSSSLSPPEGDATGEATGTHQSDPPQPRSLLAKSPGFGGSGAFTRRRVSSVDPSEPPPALLPPMSPLKVSNKPASALDPIQLSIFAHRFMSIAEQMGRTLQRTSVSVNIKERLDFSCALFGPDGGLVANAPHIPVHLGAMQEAVRYQREHWGDRLKEGDVLVSNHPQLAGGSHLPDITVITPVFSGGAVVFWVASRGHHADIGGISPGSMPPQSKSLSEEGAAIVGFKLVEDGEFQEAGIVDLLLAPGRQGIPGCSGSRNLQDNLSDLKAQVAANQKGITLMQALIGEYSLEVVQSYMVGIMSSAEAAVRDMLVTFSKRKGMDEIGRVYAEDQMDDGTPICLTLTIDRKTKTAEFDFSGTGPEVLGNCNAPPAVTYSAVIYCLRCLVGTEIPLNQGCLAPVRIIIPEGSILRPSPSAAVVGGNVLTSQRVVDVVFKAFDAVAASQGCMNNLTFGNDVMGYYETIAGGSGAGPTWHGRSGVHTHMTNTRITDPEILERRFPVILQQFSLRRGSGGNGRYNGGAGVIREIEFRCPMSVGILSERRSVQPYGLDGGAPGAKGVNLLVRKGGRLVSMGGKCSVEVGPWDRIRILTPGGGGYGVPGPTSHPARSRSSIATESEASLPTAVVPTLDPLTVIPPTILSAAAASIPRASGSVAAYAAVQNTV